VDSEEEIFGLMKAAKDQQAAVASAIEKLKQERETAARERAAFLADAKKVIAQLDTLKTNLATDAGDGIIAAVAGIGGRLTQPIKDEVETTVARLTEARSNIEEWVKWFRWRLIALFVLMSFSLGFGLQYAMYTKNLKTMAERVANIEQSLEQKPAASSTSSTASQRPVQTKHRSGR
jgi:uncharacterized phage infection (PIP) family protein YhgE